jgi:starvation-inducible DNA-binding protein
MPTRTKTHKDTKHNGRVTGSMVATHHDLAEDVREQMVQLLNAQMADLFDLFSQTKQAHWNVKGPQFHSLHLLYDELAEHLLAHVDTVAERATALGGTAEGTVRMAGAASRLPEFSREPVESLESVRLLVERYAKVAETMRQAIDQAEEAGDMASSDLFIDVTRDLDKALWFLEAHIQRAE